MGTGRISPSARCLRLLACRVVPLSVQARPARGSETARSIRPHPASGRWQSASVRATASDGRMRGVVQAAVERFHPLPADALGADRGEQGAGLGG